MSGMYHYLKKSWDSSTSEEIKTRMIAWRKSEAAVVLEKPTRIDKARKLGYKAKKGFVVVRIRLKRGGRKRSMMGVKGRKSRKQHHRKILKMNYQWVAEIRAAKKFKNLEILNSYQVGKDGKNYFFDVIMIDPERPEIKNDPVYSWISNPKNSNRAERGLTSAAKKSRGLRKKSRNMKVRPSLRSWGRKGK
ncbi:MAG: 50S ribosomal protein L15e [Nanoarchaeota archaeon]